MTSSSLARSVCAGATALGIAGCATTPGPGGPGGDREFDTPTQISATRPQVIPLGGSGLWITSTQSVIMRDLLIPASVGEDCNALAPAAAADCLKRREVAEKIDKYGEFYRQLAVDLGDGDWIPSADTKGNRQGNLGIDCTKTGQGPLAQFFGNLIGFKRARTAALTVTVSATQAAADDESSANDFVSDYPLLFVVRNKEKKGTCEYKLNDTPLTPFLSPWPKDNVFLKVKVHWTDSSKVDLSNTISLVASIGALTGPSAGFTTKLADIGSADLSTKINTFLDGWQRDVYASRVFTLPLNVDKQKPFDKVVLSINPPQNPESFDLIKFGQGPAISLRYSYASTMFAECGGELDIELCRFSEPDVILAQQYGSNPKAKSLQTLAGESPNPDQGEPSLTTKLNTAAKSDAPRDSIGAVCSEAKGSNRFAPYGAMNKIDRKIFLYAWLKHFVPEWSRSRALQSDDCFDKSEEELLESLGKPNDRPFMFPRQAPDVLYRQYLFALSQQLINGSEGKKAAFGDEGALEIAYPRLVEGLDRPPAPSGSEAASALEELKFKAGGLACDRTGLDPDTGRATDRIFGFLYLLDDRLRGDGKTFFAPFVVELADEAEPEKGKVVLKSMYIAGTVKDYFQRLNYPQAPAKAWEGCSVRPTDQEALDAMRTEMGD